MTTTVPFPTFGPKGFIAPTEADVLTGAQTDIDAAFGGGLNPALETPQGQLASSLTAIIGNVNDTFLKYTQQVDPSYADGRMQDGIARIYFLERKPALSTVVAAVCSGATGLVIPAGSIAQAEDGNVYLATQDGTIGADGTVEMQFSCQQAGAITCAAHALNTIYQTIPGWDSIDNPVDGVVGQDVETRADFEARRFDSVANNALGFMAAVLGSVWELPDVIDAYVTENYTASPVTVRGVTIDPRSLYVCVEGGEAADIAKQIWLKKAPGCGFTGDTTVTVYDDVSGYDPPLPPYTVKFQIPDELPVAFSVLLANNPQIPANAPDLISDAIIGAFAGVKGKTPQDQTGGQRERIGSTVYASRYYAPVANLGSWAQIISIDVGSPNAATATITGSIGGSGATSVLTITSIIGSVAVGDYLSGSVGGTAPGSDVLLGTQIVAQLTGTAGSVGTYSVSQRQTVPSIAMLGYRATNNTVACNIDQMPVTSALIIATNTS